MTCSRRLSWPFKQKVEMRAADIGCDIFPIGEYGFYLRLKPEIRSMLEQDSALPPPPAGA